MKRSSKRGDVPIRASASVMPASSLARVAALNGNSQTAPLSGSSCCNIREAFDSPSAGSAWSAANHCTQASSGALCAACFSKSYFRCWMAWASGPMLNSEVAANTIERGVASASRASTSKGLSCCCRAVSSGCAGGSTASVDVAASMHMPASDAIATRFRKCIGVFHHDGMKAMVNSLPLGHPCVLPKRQYTPCFFHPDRWPDNRRRCHW